MPNLKDHTLYPLVGSKRQEMAPVFTFVDIDTDASVKTTSDSVAGTWTKPAGTGIYRFVLTGAVVGPASLCFFVPVVEAAVAVDLVAQIHAKSITAGVLTIDVILNAGATPTDPSAATRITMLGWVKTSAVLP